MSSTQNGNQSDLQKAGADRASQKESTGAALHRHATNALIGLNNFMANANRKQSAQQKSNSNSNPTISEKKRQADQAKEKKIETFAEDSLKTIFHVLGIASLGIDFMMFSEYYNKNNVMQGISVNEYPYVEENPNAPKNSTNIKKGIFSSSKDKSKTGWRKSIDRTLLGYSDSWQAPWKNKATKEYPNVANWGLGTWIMFFATKVCASVVALSRYSLYTTFQVSSRIWNPKNVLINALYLAFGYIVYSFFNYILKSGVWAGLLTLVFMIMKSSLITNNWNLFTPPEDPDEEPRWVSIFKGIMDGFAKFFILFGLYFVLAFFNTVYLSGAFMFMFLLTPFMGDFIRGGDPDSTYNFRQRFMELLWKNKTLISLFCLIFITVDAYKNIGTDTGYVFTGVTVGLFIAFLYGLIRGG